MAGAGGGAGEMADGGVNMKKEAELCGECQAKMEEGYKVIALPRPANNKITCALCGRRRYGGTYRLEKKQGAR